MVRALLITAGAAALASCATKPDAPVGPPTATEAPGRPAPPQARLYVDCVAQAADRNAYDRDATLNVIRFRCDGETARVFYEGLGPWSAKIGSELVADGRTWRFGSRMERNPSGLDHCSKGAGDDWRCTVVLNVGEFLASTP